MVTGCHAPQESDPSETRVAGSCLDAALIFLVLSFLMSPFEPGHGLDVLDVCFGQISVS